MKRIEGGRVRRFRMPHAEILSPGTARTDRTVKLRKHAECGVSHYWLVDAAACTLGVLRLGADGHYVLMASLGPGDRYEPEAFAGVVVGVDALFADLDYDDGEVERA